MALAATRSPVGLEFMYEIDPDMVFYVPGDPGVTYEKGNVVIPSNGLFIEAGDSDVPPYAVMQETVICPSLATGFPVLSDCVTDGSALARTLLPVKFNCGRVQLFKATFGGHTDDTVAAYSAATPSLTLTTALGGDDDPNGAVVYVYDGPGAGQWNIIEDYVNGTKVCTLTRAFAVDITTASKVIVIEGEGGGAARGIGFGGRTDLKTVATIAADDGANDGDFFVMLDGRNAAEFLRQLTLPIARFTEFA